jgi:tripartite-type tricarboxylate transporter receptor subunit TctC
MKCRFRNLLLCCIAAALPAAAAAQQYPTKPVRLIVPFPPGGGSDTLARIVSPKLGEALGQQLVIDNRPGGGTNIGAEIAAKSQADGHTLLMGNVSHAINVTLYTRLSYNLVKDFAPVSLLASTPNIVVVHPSVQAKSLKELIALAKAQPDKLNYASSGSGSSAHLAAELFNSMAGVKMNHVPYKGGGPAVIALVGGQCQIGFATTPSVIQHIKSGKMRGLAVTSAKRSPSTPDLPTVSESGVMGYEAGTWYGFLVPAGTPKPVVTRLHAESVKLLKAPDAKQRLDAAGFESSGTTPAEFSAYIRSEVAKWAKVVRSAGVKAD